MLLPCCQPLRLLLFLAATTPVLAAPARATHVRLTVQYHHQGATKYNLRAAKCSAARAAQLAGHRWMDAYDAWMRNGELRIMNADPLDDYDQFTVRGAFLEMQDLLREQPGAP